VVPGITTNLIDRVARRLEQTPAVLNARVPHIDRPVARRRWPTRSGASVCDCSARTATRAGQPAAAPRGAGRYVAGSHGMVWNSRRPTPFLRCA